MRHTKGSPIDAPIMHNRSKRKQSALAQSSKKPSSSLQTRLTQHFHRKEQCPHCQQYYSSLASLIDHVEAAHLSTSATPLAVEHKADSGSTDIPWDLVESTAQPHDDSDDLTAVGLAPAAPAPVHSIATAAATATAEDTSQQQAKQQQQQAKKQQQQAAWWQQTPTDPIVAHIRFASWSSSSTNSSQPLQPVRLSALNAVVPVELVLHALPAGLANSLLTELLAQSEGWVAGSWWFGGQQQTAPRSSTTYLLKQPPGGNLGPSTVGAVHAASGIQSSASQDLAALPQLPAPPILQQAAALVSTAVNSRVHTAQHRTWQAQREALTAQLTGAGRRGAAAAVTCLPVTAGAPTTVETVQQGAAATAGSSQVQDASQQQQHPCANVQEWLPSYVLANLYKDGQQSVGSHSDRLSSLGPLPTIASVSLGAGRVFRLHPADSSVAATAAAKAGGGASGAGSSTSSGSSGRAVSSVDIQLPHNSLLIMWPPTQEQWKHEIPKTKKVAPHSVSGSARINLTFRQLQPAWAAAVPHCRCARPAIMRCSLQGRRFVYYFACDNTKGPGCGLYKPAVTLDI